MESEEFRVVRELLHELAGKSEDDVERRLKAPELSPAVVDELRSLLRQVDQPEATSERLSGLRDQVLSFAEGLPESIPRRIGGFEIQKVLGRGGMGIVYRGVQNRPRREVAVKVLQSLVSSPESLRRFEFEADVLARLDHPNIAKVIEAGVDAEQGNLPYIAMELVVGSDLIAHCAEHALGYPERIQLFLSVCEGVEHAHQQGVIHRDLKPSNILVSLDDRPAHPRLWYRAPRR